MDDHAKKSKLSARESANEATLPAGPRSGDSAVVAEKLDGLRGSAQSTLFTVLAELAAPDATTPIHTSSFLYVLSGMGFGEQAVRQAIARADAAGWIEGEKRGRQTRWLLSQAAMRLISQGEERVFSWASSQATWDGQWLCLIISIPQARQNVRRTLYAKLRWVGFGNPVPGLWITPHVERRDEAHSVIAELGLEGCTLSVQGVPGGIGMQETEVIARSWDFEEIGKSYRVMLDAFGHLSPAPGDEVLFAHLSLAHALRSFPLIDPQLPEVLLPDWIGRRAARLFRDLRIAWTPAAHARWHEIVSRDAGK